MATGAGTAGANTALTALIGAYTWIELHTASPGAAGTTAVASNSTRKQITYGSVSGGSVTTTADLVWSAVGATEIYTHFSVFTASSAGTFGFSGTISGGSVVTGNDFKILTGNLTVSMTLAS